MTHCFYILMKSLYLQTFLQLFQDMIEDGDTDEFNEAIKGFDIKSYEDLQVKHYTYDY